MFGTWIYDSTSCLFLCIYVFKKVRIMGNWAVFSNSNDRNPLGKQDYVMLDTWIWCWWKFKICKLSKTDRMLYVRRSEKSALINYYLSKFHLTWGLEILDAPPNQQKPCCCLEKGVDFDKNTHSLRKCQVIEFQRNMR